jgi:branched-chain amino acid transport system substrate-binding protein
MRRLLLLVSVAGLLAYGLSFQFQSFARMGDRRSLALNHRPKEILLGVCWPFAANQDGMWDGLQMALSEINSGGLASGIPVRLLVRDDDFDWEKGKRIAVEFSGIPEMSAVLGYYDDIAAIKASPMFEASKLLQVVVGANSTSMTIRGFNYIVRTTLSSEKIARSLAKMSVARGYKRYALLWEQDAYGEDLAYEYHIRMDELNEEVLYRWSYARERADFRLAVNELKGIDADVIFFAGLEPWAGDFLREARAVGVKADIIGAFSDTPEMRKRAGPGLEGSMYFDMYSASSASPESQAFVRKFRARYGRDPDTWAAQGYDSLMLIAKAVQFTGSANPLDLSYAIRFMDRWDGANGSYKFDGTGELDDKPIFLNMYRNGTPVTILESHPEPVSPVQ